MTMTEGGRDIDDLDLLTAPQARLIGALMEKEMVTPDSYPLSLRSLISACNQTTSRSPVVDYAESLVDTTLHALKAKGLVRFVHPSHGERVTKYRQVLTEKLDLGPAERALITLLLLRGPQTTSELRTRSERMHPFDGPDRVESTLAAMAAAEPPLVERVPRQAGQKGDRWIQLLEVDPEGRSGVEGRPGGSDADRAPISAARTSTDPGGSSATSETGGHHGGAVVTTDGRIADLERRIARLESQVSALAAALGEDPDVMTSDPDVADDTTTAADDASKGVEGPGSALGD